jgi:peroxiredoxin Q/BCP
MVNFSMSHHRFFSHVARVSVAAAVSTIVWMAVSTAHAQSVVPMNATSRPEQPTSAPAVGADAPDFTAAWGDSAGIKAMPFTLHGAKGRVVVLAFYPGDRTGGCTIELSRFRDDYAKLFGTSDDVLVLPTSVDSVESHVSWAQEMNFPFSLVSDHDGKVATLYGSMTAGESYANRTVFVIGKDGKVAYENLHFASTDDQAYTDLAAAVKKALQ